MRIKAEYNLHPLPQFNGNPLTEALAICQEPEVLADEASTNLGPVDFWNISTVYQHAVLQDFSSIYVAAPQSTIMYMKFAALILDTYSKSHPFNPKHSQYKYELAKQTHARPPYFDSNLELPSGTTASSMLIHGLSGIGKTIAIRTVLSWFPQVITHHSYNGKHYRQDQIVWISLDLPSTPSVKAFALNFFLAVDVALGTSNYYEAWSQQTRASVDQHLNAMRQIAKTHEVGLIHIDELKFMLKYAKSKDSPTLQMLEALFNKIGIPLVLSSTSAGLELLEMPLSRSTVNLDMTTTRRMLNDREIKFDLLRRDNKQFDKLFNAFFPSFLQRPGTELCPNFKDKFHHLSCGLPAIMARLAHLYHETLIQLVGKNSKVPPPVILLEHVYKQQFKLIGPALEQLRARNVKQYEAMLSEIEQQRGAYSDKEKKAIRRGDKKIVPSVKKDGMFEHQVAMPISGQQAIPKGFI
jgi:hypothetical protein